MENKGKFKPGTRFVGNVSGAVMEVLEIRGDFVLILDVARGTKHVHGLKMLEHCNVTILDENKNRK